MSYTLQFDSVNLRITVTPCPAGFNLVRTGNLLACSCTGAKDEPNAVLDCDDENSRIILRVRQYLYIIWYSKTYL